MNEQALISVIIPAYNTANTILRTLKSIEDQTYQNHEIVIINDGSPDNIKEIIETYKTNNLDKKIIIHHQENKGVSAARNKGIELATGDFICFLDSDDTYDITFMEKMLKKQISTKSDVVYCGYNYIKNGLITTKRPKVFYEHGVFENYFTDGYFSFSCLLIKSNIIKNQIYFPEDLKLAEDQFFVIQLFCKTNFTCVKEYLLNYFCTYESVTSNLNKDEQYYLDDINGYNKIFNFINKNYFKEDKKQLLENAKHKILKSKNTYISYICKKQGYRKMLNYISNFDGSEFNVKTTSYNKKFIWFFKNSNKIKIVLGFLYYKYLRK